MASNPLSVAFAKLESQIRSGQRKKALKTVEEVLKLEPKDEDALKSKAVLLIHLERFEEALGLIKTEPLDPLLWFEKAYCLYRLGDLTQSLEVLRQAGTQDSQAKLQLQAQIHHRIGDYEAAIRIYQELFQHHKVTSLDVRTNIIAAYVSGGKSGEVTEVMDAMNISAKDGFEVAFNLACSKLHSGDIGDARELLQLALRSGRESLVDEEYTEEQVDQELAPLVLQLAYVAAQAGQHHEAHEQYQDILHSTAGDEGMQAVAINNRIAEQIVTTPLDKQRPLALDALRQSDSLFEKGTAGLRLKRGVEHRLSLMQQQTLYANRALLLLYAGRNRAARDLMQQLMKRYPDAVAVQMLRATMAARECKYQEAEGMLQNTEYQALPDVQLLRAQLAVQMADLQRAAQLLADLPKWESKPAIVSTQAALLEAAGDEQAALKLVSSAYSSQLANKRLNKAEKAALGRSLLPSLARLQLKAGSVDAAFKTFQQLHAMDTSTASSATVVGQLASAALSQNPSAASALDKHLDELPAMQAESVADLEAAGTMRMAKGHSSRAENTESGAQKRTRKQRRKRLPKNFDPDNPGPPPNPERWLPKWQRADFKRKRKSRKDKEKAKTSHQGGVVDESLDRTRDTDGPAGPSVPNMPKRARARGKTGRR